MAANYGLFNRTLYNKLLKATEKAHKGALLRRGNGPKTEAYYEHNPKVKAYGELITLLLHVKSTLDHGGHGSGHGSTDVEEILSKYTRGAPLDYQRIIHASVMNRTVRNAAEQFFSELFGKKYVEKDVDPSHHAHARPSSRPLQPTPAPRGRTGPALARARAGAGAGAGAGDIKGFEEYVSTEFDTIKRRLDSHDELFDGLYANYEEYKGYLKNKEKDLLRLDELSGFVDRWRILINRGHFPTRQEMDEITRKLKVLEGEVTAFQVAFDEIKEYVDRRLQEHSKNIDRKIAQERVITAQAFDEERKYTKELARLLAGQIRTLQNTLGEYEDRTSQLEAQIFALNDLDPGATIKLLKILKGMGLDEYIRKIFSELESLKKQPPSQEIMDRLVVLENWIKGVGEQEIKTISDALNAAIEAAWVKQKAYIDEKDKGLQDQIAKLKGTLEALISKTDTLNGKIDTKADKTALEALQKQVADLEAASRKLGTSDAGDSKRKQEITKEIQTQLLVIEKGIDTKIEEKIKEEARRVDAIIAELTTQIKGLQTGHDALSRNYDVLTRDLTGKLSKDDFNYFTKIYDKDKLELDGKIKGYASRIEELSRELQKLKDRPPGPGVPDQGILDRIKKIESDLPAMQGLINQHATAIQNLEQTIITIVERILKAKVEQERKTTQDSIKIVQDSIKQTQQNYDAAIAELRNEDAKLKADIEALKREKADQSRVAALEGLQDRNHKELKQQYDALALQLAALERRLQAPVPPVPPGPGPGPGIPPAVDLKALQEAIERANKEIRDISQKLADLDRVQKQKFEGITTTILETILVEIKKNNDVKKQEIGRDLLVFLDGNRKVLDELRIRLVGNNVNPNTIRELQDRITALEKQIAEGIPEAPEFAQLQAEMGDINTNIINLNQKNIEARLAEFQQKQLLDTRQFEMALVDANYADKARLMKERKERILREYDGLFSTEFDRRAKEIKEKSALDLKNEEERIRARFSRLSPGTQGRLLAFSQTNINVRLEIALSKLAAEIRNSQQPHIERDIAAMEMEVANKIRQENEHKITAQMERLKNDLSGKLDAFRNDMNGELAAIRANADRQKESLEAFQRQLSEQQRAIDRINAQSAEALAKANAVGADVDALKPQVRTAVADANAAKGDAKTAKETSAVAAVDAKAAKDISTALADRVTELQAALKKAEDDKKKYEKEFAALQAEVGRLGPAVIAAHTDARRGIADADTAQKAADDARRAAAAAQADATRGITAAAAAHGAATNARTVAAAAQADATRGINDAAAVEAARAALEVRVAALEVRPPAAPGPAGGVTLGDVDKQIHKKASRRPGGS